MGDKNPIRSLGYYSKPIYEGYRNTIELPVGNNVVPLRSDTIRLVKNGCSFYGLRSEHPNQHLKDFLKLVDSLDLDGENREEHANYMAPKSTAVISHDEREELRKKGVKSPSKLFSLKYLSLASIKELKKNPLAPKRVHFVNLIVILSKDNDMEEDVSSNNACIHDLGKMTRGNEEVKEQGKDEDEMETNVRVKEVIKEEERNLKLMKKLKKYSKRRKRMKMMKTLTYSQL
nr:zinc finger, CCHC-type [Tanacetum cinerariifolium]